MNYQVATTLVFDAWLKKLKDRTVKTKILARLDRVSNGNFGDFKQISDDLYELRFFFGSGWRVYYTIKNDQVIFLLNGGDKSNQSEDIDKAKKILTELE